MQSQTSSRKQQHVRLTIGRNVKAYRSMLMPIYRGREERKTQKWCILDVRTTGIQNSKSLTKNRDKTKNTPGYISQSPVRRHASHHDSCWRDEPKHMATGSVGMHVIYMEFSQVPSPFGAWECTHDSGGCVDTSVKTTSDRQASRWSLVPMDSR